MEDLIEAIKSDDIPAAALALSKRVLIRVQAEKKGQLLSNCRSKLMFELLVNNGYVPTATTLANVAAFRAKYELLGWLLEYGIPVDGYPQQHAKWHTPLMIAACQGAQANVKLLLAYGADPKLNSGREMWTALHSATSACSGEWQYDPSYFQFTETVENLIEAGANVDVQCDTGATPLMFSARSRNPQVCAVLLRHGAHPNAIDLHNKTALDYVNQLDQKLFAFDANPVLGIKNAKLVVECLSSNRALSPATIDFSTGEIAGR